MAQPIAICRPRNPSPERWLEAAKHAQSIRADNVPEGVDLEKTATQMRAPGRGRLAVDVRYRWPRSGKQFTVGFLDGPSQALRTKILAHMNMWQKTANVGFTETAHTADADVRIARTPNDGHWSWLGTDIKNHPGEATMNLDSFTDATDASEFLRVVCHETGHTLGFPHEHLRAELVAKLDREKTIAFYMADQGWTRDDVIFQLLTKLERRNTDGTPVADPRSIMCYEVPGECTIDGTPIVGGTEIDPLDFEFAGRVYPRS